MEYGRHRDHGESRRPFSDSASLQSRLPIHETTLDISLQAPSNRHTPLHFSSSDQLVPLPLRARADFPTSSSLPTSTQVSATRLYPRSPQVTRSGRATRSSFESDTIMCTPIDAQAAPSTFHQPRRQPRRHSYRQSTFADESDVHLFAAALSGLDGSGVSPQPQDLSPVSPTHPAFSYQRQDVPHVNPDEGRSVLYNTLLTPNIHVLPPSAEDQQPYFQSNRSRTEPPSPINVADAMIGLDEPEQLPLPDEDEDDGLPDYWQSQQEAAERARSAAARRAAELERRWARRRGA